MLLKLFNHFLRERFMLLKLFNFLNKISVLKKTEHTFFNIL